MPGDPWRAQLESLGAFIRSQRRLSKLSLRELAELAHVSNPYLSQIERGLHEPSVRVLSAVARALGLPAEMLLARAGLMTDEGRAEPGTQTAGSPSSASRATTESAIRADGLLTDEQKEALLAVYRSYVARRESR